MPDPTDDPEMLYRKVVHLLQHSFRTATYKLATTMALVDFSTENLDRRSANGQLRVPISDLARRVIALYWIQVRPFEGRILKQSTQPRSRILDAVLAIQAAAGPDGDLLPIDDAAERAATAFRRGLDIVSMTLAQQPLPRLQRMAGATQSVTFLYDDSFLGDNVSRAALQVHGDAIQLKPGVARNLARSRVPLQRTLASMWVDDVVRMNGISAERRTLVEDHLFGPDHEYRRLARSVPSGGIPQPSEMQVSPAASSSLPTTPVTFAERLNFLFESFHPETDTPYSSQEVAARLRARGHRISTADVANLRLGREKNLSRSGMKAIAEVFGVDHSYLTGDSEDAELSLRHGEIDHPLTNLDRDGAPAGFSDGEQASQYPADKSTPERSVGRHRAAPVNEYDSAVGSGVPTVLPQLPPNIEMLASRLNTLFEQHLAQNGDAYTNAEVASSLQEDGLAITEGLIARLRSASGSLPGLQTLDALAFFFDVDVEFFNVGSPSTQLKGFEGGSVTQPAARQTLPDRFDSTSTPTSFSENFAASPEMLAGIVQALSKVACSYLEAPAPDIAKGRAALQTLGMIGTELADSAEEEISIDLDLVKRIVADWSPIVTTADTHYRIFRQIADYGESAGAETYSDRDDRDHDADRDLDGVLDRWTRQERDQGVSSRWTLDSFVDAVTNPSDQDFLATLLKRFADEAQTLGDHTPFWYGVRPGGGLFLYPFGLRHPPFQLVLDASNRLNVRGNWRGFPRVAGHAGFTEMAALLGQHQSGPSRNVLVEGLDADALWDIAEKTARVINS